jgi:hypothetical protein
MTNKEYLAIRTKALALEKNRKGYLSYLCETFNCDKQQARIIYDKLVDNKPVETVGPGTNIILGTGYTYNQLNDKYIVPLTTYGREYVCPGDQHRAMLNAYSNWKGDEQTLEEIARTYKMRKEWVREYFKIMGWSHDTVPITDEEIALDKGKEAITRVLQTKRTEITQELEHADWKQTQEDAEQWRMFEASRVDPYIRALNRWKPKIIKPLKTTIVKKGLVKNVFVVGLSDLHIGLKASRAELVKGEDYNIEIVNNIIDNYATAIAKDVAERNYSFEKCVIISAGDILHSLTGYTEKGTLLECDVLREEQFEEGFDCLQRFITRILEIFGTVEVHATKGNHSASDWILFKTLECLFSNNKNIKFHNYKARTSIFRIKNTAILLDHGESDFIKAKIPSNDIGRESYVQNKFLELGDTVGKGIKSRIFIQGDKHHFEQTEFRSFEFIMLSSCVTGDKYADHLGLHSRPRQNCLIIDNSGIKEVLHYYLD